MEKEYSLGYNTKEAIGKKFSFLKCFINHGGINNEKRLVVCIEDIYPDRFSS